MTVKDFLEQNNESGVDEFLDINKVKLDNINEAKDLFNRICEDHNLLLVGNGFWNFIIPAYGVKTETNDFKDHIGYPWDRFWSNMKIEKLACPNCGIILKEDDESCYACGEKCDGNKGKPLEEQLKSKKYKCRCGWSQQYNEKKFIKSCPECGEPNPIRETPRLS